jgi:exonuclease SbcC
VYDHLEKLAKERAREYDGQIKGLEGKMSELRRQADQRDTYIEFVVQAGARVAELADRQEAAERDLDAAQTRVQELERHRLLRDEQQRQLQQLNEELERLRTWIARRRADVQRAHTLLEQRTEILAGVAALHTARTELAQLAGLRNDFDLLQHERRMLETSINNARMKLEGEQRLAESEQRRLREQAAQAPQLHAEVEQLTRKLAGLAPLAQELEANRARRSELRERIRKVNELTRNRDTVQNQINMKHDSLVATREELKRTLEKGSVRLRQEPALRAALGHAIADRDALQREQDRLNELRRDDAELAERAAAIDANLKTISDQGKAIREKITMLSGDIHACPLCGSELGHDGVAHIEQEYQRERQILLDQHADLKTERDQIKTRREALANELAHCQARAAGLSEQVARVANLTAQLDELARLQAQHTDEQRTLNELMVQIAQGDYERGARAQLARLEAELAALGKVEALDRELDALERRNTTLEENTKERSQIEVRIGMCREKLAQIERDEPALHDVEDQALSLKVRLAQEQFAENERQALRRLDTQLAALGYDPQRETELRTVISDLEHWQKEQTRLEAAENWLTDNEPELAAREAELQQRETQQSELAGRLETLNRELQALPQVQRERDRLKQIRDEAARQRQVAERDLAAKQMQLQTAENAAAELEICEAERKDLRDRHGLFADLTTAFGKKGVQAMLIETAIPEIEHEANQLLSRMTENQMHLRFVTQGATKKGDETETLEIEISDALGTRVYDAYSGGEAFRIDFAIRIALSRLLARRAGARLETLVIDEGFGSQDTRGRERLVEAISSIHNDFRRILVITHIQELKDLFPVQIEIVKTPLGSRWALG